MKNFYLVLVGVFILIFSGIASAAEFFYQTNQDLNRVWLDRLPEMTLKGEGLCRIGPDYQLGYGDTVALTLWGKLEGYYEVTLNRDGDLVVPPLGRIQIMGLTLNQARDVVRREIDRKFTNVEFDLNITNVKDIVIEVVGNVAQPGFYSVSPCGTILDAVAKAGGPNRSGTLADIRLKRDGTEIDSFNFYNYILNGRDKKPVILKHRDIIFVPAVENVYAIRGDVRYPGTYDLPGTPMLSHAIEIAGGLQPTDLKRKITIIRIDPETLQTAVAKEISLASPEEIAPEEDIQIRNYDTILVGTDSDISPYQKELFREVSVTGEVETPGRYLIEQGDKLSALLQRIQICEQTAFLEGAVFVRPALKGKEKAISDQLIAAQKQLILEEEARLAGLLLSDEKRELHQEALQLRRQALAALAARVPDGRIIIDLKKILAGEEDILLEKGDSLRIPAIPDWVLVTGAVYNPQSAAFQAGQSIDFYLEVVGGIKETGDAKGIYVIKPDGRTESRRTGFSKIQRGDIVVVPQKYK